MAYMDRFSWIYRIQDSTVEKEKSYVPKTSSSPFGQSVSETQIL